MRKVLVLGLMFGALAAFNAACSGDDDDDDAHEIPVSIAITGGTALNVGSNLQLIATATHEDASIEDVTTTSAWTSSSAANATVGAATGLVTGVSSGPTTITATHDGVVGTFNLTVSTASGATFNGTVSADWSGAHGGSNITYFARILDNAGGAIVYCSSVMNTTAVVNLVGTGVLVAGHTYHAEQFADLNSNGMADDAGHSYMSANGVAVGANQTFSIAHTGGAPTWTGVACP